jgi:DNA-directed RNA polymerase subunit F
MLKETVNEILEIESEHVNKILDAITQAANEVSIEFAINSRFVSLENLEIILNVVRERMYKFND